MAVLMLQVISAVVFWNIENDEGTPGKALKNWECWICVRPSYKKGTKFYTRGRCSNVVTKSQKFELQASARTAAKKETPKRNLTP